MREYIETSGELLEELESLLAKVPEDSQDQALYTFVRLLIQVKAVFTKDPVRLAYDCSQILNEKIASWEPHKLKPGELWYGYKNITYNKEHPLYIGDERDSDFSTFQDAYPDLLAEKKYFDEKDKEWMKRSTLSRAHVIEGEELVFFLDNIEYSRISYSDRPKHKEF